MGMVSSVFFSAIRRVEVFHEDPRLPRTAQRGPQLADDDRGHAQRGLEYSLPGSFFC